MKKFVFSIVAAATMLATQAQAQISVGPMLGLNLANISAKSGGESISTTMKAGFHIGGVANIAFTDHFSLMPGVLFSIKGFKSSQESGFGSTKVKTEANVSLNYLEIPVNVAYFFGQPGGGRLFIHAGPYIGLCLGGKIKADVSYPGSSFPSSSSDESIKVGNDALEDAVRPLDFGINAGVGYQLPMGLFVKAQYGLGLANTLPEGDGDNAMKNRVIGISVGFLFGGKSGR